MTQEFGYWFGSKECYVFKYFPLQRLQDLFFMEESTWLKSKGYLHITPQINLLKQKTEIFNKVTNPEFISKYAFFPLIHVVMKERKYKKTGLSNRKRAHSYNDDKGKHHRTVKPRPLHYATHLDAVIFGYYAEQLQKAYESRLEELDGLSESIIAYRKISIGPGQPNKGTIHFANEVFEEIKRRTATEKECFVLAFDIKSFFSTLDHDKLKQAWAGILGQEWLSADHFNVFNAATKFSYIMRDDLRIKKVGRKGKKPPFDEKRLARIRNRFGINAYFESPKEFRDKIKAGEIRVCKFPFRNKEGHPIGIPQGLPISAILANLYLLDFDTRILNELVKSDLSCFYRRYSDDIVVVCSGANRNYVEKFVAEAIAEDNVEISKEKTETFYFKGAEAGKGNKLECHKLLKSGSGIPSSFIYLGFEFDGRRPLIKSSNLAKFYRRMVFAVRRKSQRALKIAASQGGTRPVLYRGQLYKLYSALDLTKVKTRTRWKKLIKRENGRFIMITGKKRKPMKSNYFSYAKRASLIMNEPRIFLQTQNHRKIFNQAVLKRLKRKDG